MKRLHFTRCRTSLLAVLLAFSVAFVPVPFISDTSSDSAALITTAQAAQKNTKDHFSIKEVPKYSGKSSVAAHGNKPYFTSREKQNTNTFESYHKLDKLGRCGVAYANVSKDTMPTEARGFTFCGWRYTIDHDSTIHVRIKNSKKKEMENRLKAISESVKTGKMSLAKANTIRDGMFKYLSHGTASDSSKLIRYMKHQYPFQSVKQKGKNKGGKHYESKTER